MRKAKTRRFDWFDRLTNRFSDLVSLVFPLSTFVLTFLSELVENLVHETRVSLATGLAHCHTHEEALECNLTSLEFSELGGVSGADFADHSFGGPQLR